MQHLFCNLGLQEFCLSDSSEGCWSGGLQLDLPAAKVEHADQRVGAVEVWYGLAVSRLARGVTESSTTSGPGVGATSKPASSRRFWKRMSRA